MFRGLLGSSKKDKAADGGGAATELSPPAIQHTLDNVMTALKACQDRGFPADDILVQSLERARATLCGGDVPAAGAANGRPSSAKATPKGTKSARSKSSAEVRPKTASAAAAATVIAGGAITPVIRKSSAADLGRVTVPGAVTIPASSTIMLKSAKPTEKSQKTIIPAASTLALKSTPNSPPNGAMRKATSADLGAAEYKELVTALSPRGKTPYDDALNALLKQDAFNQLIPDVLSALLKFQSRSSQYQALCKTPGDPSDKVGYPQQERWRMFMSGDVPKQLKDGKLFPSKRMGTDARKSLTSSASMQKVTAEALRVLFSPKLCCAGIIGSDSNCKHSKPIDGRTKLTLETYTIDHLISIHSIGRLWDTISSRVEQQAESARPPQKLKLLELVRHLLYGMTTDPKFGWPPNVYVRCQKCHEANLEAAGGATHEKVVEGVYWAEQSGSASPRKK